MAGYWLLWSRKSRLTLSKRPKYAGQIGHFWVKKRLGTYIEMRPTNWKQHLLLFSVVLFHLLLSLYVFLICVVCITVLNIHAVKSKLSLTLWNWAMPLTWLIEELEVGNTHSVLRMEIPITCSWIEQLGFPVNQFHFVIYMTVMTVMYITKWNWFTGNPNCSIQLHVIGISMRKTLWVFPTSNSSMSHVNGIAQFHKVRLNLDLTAWIFNTVMQTTQIKKTYKDKSKWKRTTENNKRCCFQLVGRISM